MVFWPIFDPKIGFLRFYPGKLRVITLKPLLIDSTVKNTYRKVYLESLAYRAENARKRASIDSRCQSFTARRGPVVHLADLVMWLREALLSARRGPVVHRATRASTIKKELYKN